MNKKRVLPLKGFRDFLPEETAKRQWLKNRFAQICESWGYQPIETPTVEPLSIFSGQIGEDEKLFYRFKDQGDREVALRYDQTVPTCRYVGLYADKLVFPFRRYQIQSNFRAEKPQKGRYREFTQVDIDIFGSSSPLADAEVIALNLDICRQLGFPKTVALINSRDLLKSIPYKAIVAVDKLKKIGSQKVIDEMVQKGIPTEKAQQFLKQVEQLKPNQDLQTIFNYLNQSGFPKDSYRFEPTLARSFSYSQGPIWEIVIPGYEAGSIGGGERYDDLVEKVSGQKIPGTGIAFGFDRTLEALEQYNLIPKIFPIKSILVTVFSPELYEKSLALTQKLRNENINCEAYLNPNDRLAKQIKYADKKGIPYVIIYGPDEVKQSKVMLKDMKTGKQTLIKIEEVIKVIR